MNINNIQNFQNISNNINKPNIEDTKQSNSFQDILEGSINALNKEQSIAEGHKHDIATGSVKDLQKAVIDIDRAGLSLTLGLEVKNKLLSAYKEIMNTQI